MVLFICLFQFSSPSSASENNDRLCSLEQKKEDFEVWGKAYSHMKMGDDYAIGRGVTQDYEEAVICYRLAAKKDQPAAQWKLGFMYSKGMGVPKDKVKARMWFSIAARNWSQYGSIFEKDIENSMTPEQISKSEHLASTCLLTEFEDC